MLDSSVDSNVHNVKHFFAKNVGPKRHRLDKAGTYMVELAMRAKENMEKKLNEVKLLVDSPSGQKLDVRDRRLRGGLGEGEGSYRCEAQEDALVDIRCLGGFVCLPAGQQRSCSCGQSRSDVVNSLFFHGIGASLSAKQSVGSAVLHRCQSVGSFVVSSLCQSVGSAVVSSLLCQSVGSSVVNSLSFHCIGSFSRDMLPDMQLDPGNTSFYCAQTLSDHHDDLVIHFVAGFCCCCCCGCGCCCCYCCCCCCC